MGEQYYLEMKNITKSFGGVHALKGVDFRIALGKVNVLIGENGAGKSTLMKVISGAHRQDSGEVLINGSEVVINSPQEAFENGIVMVYQELNLVPDMSVVDNMFLGVEKNHMGLLKRSEMKKEIRELMADYNLPIDPDERVGSLSTGLQQMIEIMKAVRKNAKVIVMDEPTSSLTLKEVEQLFVMIERLTRDGVGVVYISHRMEEIFRIGDYVTVMRDGEGIGEWPLKEIDQDFLIQKMVGRKIEQMFPKEDVPIGDVVLKVENLTKKGMYEDVSFELHRGEILGMAGLIGAGRTEVCLGVFGHHKPDSGKIFLRGEEITNKNCGEAIRRKIAYVSEDRKRMGLDLNAKIRDNISLPNMDIVGKGGFVDRAKEDAMVDGMIEKLNIKTPSSLQLAGNLSGGNQQKVVLAKWLSRDADVLIVDEPTRGVDVGAKEEIHRLIVEMAKNGCGIIMISSELPEVLGMSDRIITMYEGHVTGLVDLNKDENVTQESLMELMTKDNK